MNREEYIAQVRLLLDCLPTLSKQSSFALKGGTAINFFVQDLPRLSVDIDLTFVHTGSSNHCYRRGINNIGSIHFFIHLSIM